MKTIVPALAIFAIAISTSCKKENSVPVSLTASNVSDMYTETGLPVQISKTHFVDANIGGYLEALPAHYANHPKKKFPLIIFLNGSGSLGDGSKSALTIEDNIAIPYLIAHGKFPANFTVNGFKYQFIVLTPQFKAWPVAENVNDMINYAVKTYRIDGSRIYICGLSMGGGTTWDYASAYGNRVAAVVPICGASAPTMDKAHAIARDNLPVWAFHNNGDPTVPSWYSVDYVHDINSYNPPTYAKLTLFQATVHDAWSKATNPNYTEKNMNIYEWMLKHKK
jgi:predicted peptidase